jgi:hypothetical protein
VKACPGCGYAVRDDVALCGDCRRDDLAGQRRGTTRDEQERIMREGLIYDDPPERPS